MKKRQTYIEKKNTPEQRAHRTIIIITKEENIIRYSNIKTDRAVVRRTEIENETKKKERKKTLTERNEPNAN